MSRIDNPYDIHDGTDLESDQIPCFRSTTSGCKNIATTFVAWDDEPGRREAYCDTCKHSVNDSDDDADPYDAIDAKRAADDAAYDKELEALELQELAQTQQMAGPPSHMTVPPEDDSDDKVTDPFIPKGSFTGGR